MLDLFLFFSFILSINPAPCFGDEEASWKIGGKIHFEEVSGSDYVGTVEVNRLTRAALKECFDVKSDSCASNAKILIKKQADDFIITHYEEKSRPGIGEEMHATLLYTSKRVDNGHETLRDLWCNLVEADESLSSDYAPTVEQVAKAYGKIIKPDWRFEISDVVFFQGEKECFIIAKLLFEKRDEILNNNGNPISGSFLHMTLVNVHSSVASEREKIHCVTNKLKEKLHEKNIKIGKRNGQADLEFGVSGSKERVRP